MVHASNEKLCRKIISRHPPRFLGNFRGVNLEHRSGDRLIPLRTAPLS